MYALFILPRRLLRLRCVAGVCLLLASQSSVATNAPGPHLVCDEPVFRFGIARNQTAIVHDFCLRNTGATTARITRVAASCGCVVPELEQKEIPPGGQTVLRATFSLAGRQGHQNRVIRVLAEDPVKPSLELWIEGDIVRSTFEPEIINFGTVLPTDASAHTARLTGQSASNRITRTLADSSNFVASVAEDGLSVVVRAHAPLPDGLSQATVQVFTDNANAPAMRVPVTALVVPAVRIMPSAISLPRNAPYATRTVWIRPGRAGAFTIREASCAADGVTPILTSIGAGIYRLDLKNIPISDALQGKSIVLSTSLADLPEIAIPFLFDPK